MPHLILLGDSILDNGSYTGGGPDVISQVRSYLPSGWIASLLAVDGSTTNNVADQIDRLPDGATHLVLSVGGNDALMSASRLGISLFGMTSSPQEDAIQSLADVSHDFAARYRAAIDACLLPHLPLIVCTIYDGCFPGENYQRILAAGLALFNDTILRTAIERCIPVIDLRLVCSEPEDYANPIEPSSAGGEKIARAIVALSTAPSATTYRTAIYAG
jgi:hypothetical protein